MKTILFCGVRSSEGGGFLVVLYRPRPCRPLDRHFQNIYRNSSLESGQFSFTPLTPGKLSAAPELNPFCPLNGLDIGKVNVGSNNIHTS